jgi:inosine/xanthosine triphosphate pyrophosphatase family protein
MVELMAEDTGLTVKDLQKFPSSLAEMVLDHCLTLNFLQAEKKGVCAVANNLLLHVR